jgi:hypothetical protein
MSVLMDRLEKLMPVKPESSSDYSEPGRLRFKQEPIRRAAEAFASAIQFELPKTEQELVALLWVFGEALDGHMETRLNHSFRVIEDFISHSAPPITCIQKK